MGGEIQALYYEDPALDACSAEVRAAGEEGRLIELDRTLFFPEGGGQPCDLGSIDGHALEWVRAYDGGILHRLQGPSRLEPGARVALALDRPRRRDHSEQHSAQHLLSGIFWDKAGIQTRSFHLGPEQSTIDLDTPEIDAATVEEAESLANTLVASEIPFIIHRCPPEDPGDLPLRKQPPTDSGEIRIIEIVGLDFSPCCGTHVETSLGLRLVKILGTERYKGTTRLSFIAGGRAVDKFVRVYSAARAAGRLISSPAENLEPETLRLLARVKELSARARNFLEALVELEIERGVERGDRILILDLPGPTTEAVDAGIRGLSETGLPGLVRAKEGFVVAVLAAPGRVLPESIRSSVKALGGRGGGPPSSFRVSFPDAASASAFADASKVALSTEETGPNP